MSESDENLVWFNSPEMVKEFLGQIQGMERQP